MSDRELLNPKWKDKKLWQIDEKAKESLEGKNQELELELDTELDFNVWIVRNRGRKGFGG